jgi:hypothetical protein
MARSNVRDNIWHSLLRYNRHITQVRAMLPA